MIRSEYSVGWIPNVAGRLSFSHIGKSSYPRRCLFENTGGEFGRRIVAAQERRLSDWLLPNWYFRALYGFSADWRFLLVATTAGDPFDRVARLEGEVLVFDKEDWRRLIEGVSGAETVEGIFHQELLPWAQKGRQAKDRDERPDASLTTLRALAMFSFAVGIRRSGVVWLRPLSIASDLSFADDYTTLEHSPRADDVGYLANQVFFFLKDISHNHRHHHPGSDTITEVGPLDPSGSWVINSHYRIHRKVVEMRRSGDPEALYGAMGILAYLSSLRKAAARGYARLERPRGPLSYNNTEIESSIKSATEVVRWRQTQKNIAKTAFPALAIALVGMTGYERGTLGGFLRAAANEFFVRHPIYTLTLMVALAISAPFYYQLLHIHRLSPVLRAKRVLVTRTIAVHGVFWLIVSAFMFCTSILLFALKAVLAEPWAGWGRSHAQELAWIVVGGAAALSVLLIYALPFWPTRHDLFRAVAKRFRRVLAG